MLYQKTQKRSKILVLEPIGAFLFAHGYKWIKKSGCQSELLFFEADSVAISKVQLFLDVVCSSFSNIIKTIWDGENWNMN